MNKRLVKKYILLGIVVIAVCYIVKNFAFFEGIVKIGVNAAFPLLLGAVVAYIFNILLTFYEKHFFPKSESDFIAFARRPICIILSFLSAIALIALILTIVIPEMVNAVKLVSQKIPPMLMDGKDLLIKELAKYPDIQKDANDLLKDFDIKTVDWSAFTSKTAAFLKNGLPGLITSAVGIVDAVSSAVVDTVLAVIFAAYILFRKDKLIRDGNRFLKMFVRDDIRVKIKHVCKVANETFRDFFVGQFLDAMILGCMCFIGMSILRLPYAGMSSVLVGVTALIPIVGAFIGAGVSVFIIFTENPIQALIFIALILLLQQIEGNFVYPKIVGDSVGLPGIWVLAATTFGGGIWGFMGMLVGVPIAATIYKLLFEMLRNKEALAGIPDPDAVDENAEKFKLSTLFRRKKAPENQGNNAPQNKGKNDPKKANKNK